MYKSEAKDSTKILRLIRLKSTCNILVEKETEKQKTKVRKSQYNSKNWVTQPNQNLECFECSGRINRSSSTLARFIYINIRHEEVWCHTWTMKSVFVIFEKISFNKKYYQPSLYLDIKLLKKISSQFWKKAIHLCQCYNPTVAKVTTIFYGTKR